MMKLFIPLAFVILSVSCRNRSADKRGAGEDTLAADSLFSWQPVYDDSSGKFEMRKNISAAPDSLDAGSILTFLNANNPNVKLELLRTSRDTVYLKIADATYLTQQMGSSGAMTYLATVIYNMTEIPGINFVTFDFEEGDHAAPGTYDRTSFREEIIPFVK